MKRFTSFTIALLFSTNSFAVGELVFNNTPLTLLLSNNNQAQVSTCSDFISLRKAGNTIKDLPGVSDPDYGIAKAALIDCYISAYITQHNLKETNAPRPSLKEILQHLPATEKLIASDEEKEKIEKHYKGKSIWDTSPDLIKEDDIFVSKSDDTGYRLIDSKSFIDPNKKPLDILIMSAFTMHGTYGVRHSYIINSKNKTIWDVSTIDENSPL